MRIGIFMYMQNNFCYIAISPLTNQAITLLDLKITTLSTMCFLGRPTFYGGPLIKC